MNCSCHTSAALPRQKFIDSFIEYPLFPELPLQTEMAGLLIRLMAALKQPRQYYIINRK
jgi:hypothetical protein